MIWPFKNQQTLYSSLHQKRSSCTTRLECTFSIINPLPRRWHCIFLSRLLENPAGPAGKCCTKLNALFRLVRSYKLKVSRCFVAATVVRCPLLVFSVSLVTKRPVSPGLYHVLGGPVLLLRNTLELSRKVLRWHNGTVQVTSSRRRAILLLVQRSGLNDPSRKHNTDPVHHVSSSGSQGRVNPGKAQ